MTAELVEAVVATLVADPEAAGAIAAAPVTDTIKRADRGGDARSVVPPMRWSTERGSSRTRSIGASSGRRRRRRCSGSRRCARRSTADPEEVAAATDEAMLVEAAGGRVLIHPSRPENIKVTTPLDLRLAEMLLEERSAQQ